MLQNIDLRKLAFSFLIGFTIAFGVTTIFLIAGNADLRRENRAERKLRELSEQREKLLMISYDSLMLSVRQRDREDSVRAIRDSALSAKLIELNKSKIVTIREGYTTINSLPFNEFLRLFTGYIDSAATK